MRTVGTRPRLGAKNTSIVLGEAAVSRKLNRVESSAPEWYILTRHCKPCGVSTDCMILSPTLPDTSVQLERSSLVRTPSTRLLEESARKFPTVIGPPLYTALMALPTKDHRPHQGS